MTTPTLKFLSGELAPAGELAAGVEAARTAGELWALSWTPSALLAEAKAARGLLAVEERRDGDKEVGFVLLRAPGALWEITLIYVAPEARGTGVFDGLIAVAKRVALLCDVAEFVGPDSQRVGLEVRADNRRARNAYERVGFHEVSRRKAYYQDGCDAILLETRL